MASIGSLAIGDRLRHRVNVTTVWTITGWRDQSSSAFKGGGIQRTIICTDSNGGTHYLKEDQLVLYDVVSPAESPPKAIKTLRTEMDLTNGHLAVLAALRDEHNTPEESARAKANGHQSHYWVSMHGFVMAYLDLPWENLSVKQCNTISGAVDLIKKLCHPISGQFRYQKIYGEATKIPSEGDSLPAVLRPSPLRFNPPKPSSKELAAQKRKPRFTRTDT